MTALRNNNKALLRIKVIGGIAIFLLLLLGTQQYVVSIHDFLQIDKPVKNSKVLVVEGWMPYACLQEAYAEFVDNSYDLLITSGTELSKAYCMTDASSLVYTFYNKPLVAGTSLIIGAYGRSCEGVYPEFTLRINDEIVGQTFVGEELQAYEVILEKEIVCQKIEVVFENDGFNAEEDRNLFVEDLKINDEVFAARGDNVYLNNGYLQLKTNQETYAEQAAYLLSRMGMDEKSLVAVSSESSGGSRTAGSAVAIENWFQEQGLNSCRVNLITMGVHAKRSHFFLEHQLGSDFEVGVIAVEHPGYDAGKWWKSPQGISAVGKETLGYLYYSIFF